MRRSGFQRTKWLRLVAGAAALLWFALPSASAEEEQKVWVTGGYSFSDELGGFKIVAAGGNGTAENPFAITQEVLSASPVTMVIRAQKPIRAFDYSGKSANGFTHFRIEVVNSSGLAWLECEFELQEILHKPSIFGDGLSFDQRKSDSEKVSSNSFAHWSRDFEPYDKLLFNDGKVDPMATASFTFLVTDFTPRRTFYLVFDPRIPFS